MVAVLSENGARPLDLLTFAVSTFRAPATVKTRPTRRTVTWAQMAAEFGTHRRWPHKDGDGWSPATYKPGTTRANVNVEAVSCLVGDRDYCTFEDLADQKALLQELGLAAIIYSTYSTAPPDDVRFRVVIPLTEPVPGDRWADMWHRGNAYVFRGRNDPHTKDLSRFFYPPSAPPDAAVFVEVLEGSALDPAVLPPAPIAAALDGELSRGTIGHLGYRALTFVANGAPDGQQRGEALASARNYLAAGYTIEDTAAAIWRGLQASPCVKPEDPWTFAHADRLVRDLAKRPAPSPTPTPTPAPPAEAAPAPTRDDNALPFRTAREIARETPEAPEYIVKPYAIRGAITELDGPIKRAGKTTLTLDVVASILGRRPCLGEPTSYTPVVYLTEQTGRTFRPALARAGLLDAEDLHVLQWADVRGLAWETIAAAALARAQEVGAGLLVIDTLSQFSGVTDDRENSTGEALRAMAPLQVAAAAGLAVWIVRHDRKSGGEVGESGRGASAYSGAADTIIQMRRPSGDAQAGSNVRVLSAVSRFDVPETLVVELTATGYQPLGTVLAYASDQAEQRLLHIVPPWQDKAQTADQLAEAAKTTRSLTGKLLAEMAAAGKVSRTGGGKKGDPFRYWREPGEEMLSSPIEIEDVDESILGDAEPPNGARTVIHSSTSTGGRG